MASETIVAESSSKRPKWGENSKVYTRKNRKKDPNDKTKGENVTVCTANIVHVSVPNRSNSVDVTVNAPSATICNRENEEIDRESNTVPQPPPQQKTLLAFDESLTRNGTSGKDINESDILPQPSQPLDLAEANLSQSRQTVPASSNSLTQNKQAIVTALSSRGRVNEHEAVKPILKKIDDRIRINLKTGRPKNEIHELKRKLVNELDQVRNVVKRLEDEEFLISGNSTVSGFGSYDQFQYPMDNGRALVRVSSDVGSVVPHESRPFQPLSVTIMENRGSGELAEKEKRTLKASQYYQNSEFLLGKDRLPPKGGNKRWKSHGVKRHGRRGGRRFRADRYITKAFKGCGNLLMRLMKHKHGWVFNKPVDVEALNLHDYNDIIKQPMDLGTVKMRLSKYLYKSPIEFAEDVKLTFHNAMTYNPKGHEVHAMAEELLKIFESKWTVIESDYNLALRYEMVTKMGLPATTLRLPVSDLRNLERPEPTGLMPFDPKEKPNGGSGRTFVQKKPKAKDPDKRSMTYEEKQRLSAKLQSLPSEKLNDIVQIIKQRNSMLSQHDDEIEVDIDSVNAETLWELDRFVSNFKNNLTKKQRRSELALEAGCEATPPDPTVITPPAIAKSIEQSKIAGEKSDAIPSTDQGKQDGEGVGNSSSSSDSSSDSGSSSSDGASDSSSSNGSDGGGSPKT